MNKYLIFCFFLVISLSSLIAQTTSYGTGSGHSGGSSSYFGSYAGESSTGEHNTLVGHISGQSITSGHRNTFLGSHSGKLTTTGTENVFLGVSTGVQNITGSFNTYLGRYAGKENISGERNVYVGHKAGYNNTLGINNIFIGATAGFSELGSDKLYIDNSDTTSPLIFGDFTSNQLGINTQEIPDGYSFAVKGKAITEEIKVQLQSAWPDYVFDKEYDLPDLDFIESFIDSKGHLPDIPSAQEVVQNNGIELGKMNALLLKKIEELTLYTIQQEKEITHYESSNTNLQTQLSNQQKILEAIIQRLQELENKG